MQTNNVFSWVVLVSFSGSTRQKRVITKAVTIHVWRETESKYLFVCPSNYNLFFVFVLIVWICLGSVGNSFSYNACIILKNIVWTMTILLSWWNHKFLGRKLKQNILVQFPSENMRKHSSHKLHIFVFRIFCIFLKHCETTIFRWFLAENFAI